MIHYEAQNSHTTPSKAPTPPLRAIAVVSSPELQEIWTRSDVYHNSFLIPKDEVLEKIVENSQTSGLRDIAVSTAQGKFLNLIALSIGAKRILEVGTLGG
jgi:predicted O-methyltransferase YrrM